MHMIRILDVVCESYRRLVSLNSVLFGDGDEGKKQVWAMFLINGNNDFYLFNCF